MKKILSLLTILLALWAPTSNALPINSGDVPVALTVQISGYDWVWASPCDGASPSCAEPVTLHDGWRIPTTIEYNTMLLTAESMLSASSLCGAAWFQGNWSHCDFGNPLWRADQPASFIGWGETLLVRGGSQVPEPATLVLAAAALIGLGVTRRRKSL
jgi:hypothetical protein